MDEAHITLNRVLAFAALVEMGTGISLLLAPAIVVALLLHGEISDLVLLVARVLGIALFGLGLACLPNWKKPDGGLPAWRGMLAYNGLVALFLGYAGWILHLAGPLLWPSAVLHCLVALLLVWTRPDAGRSI